MQATLHPSRHGEVRCDRWGAKPALRQHRRRNLALAKVALAVVVGGAFLSACRRSTPTVESSRDADWLPLELTAETVETIDPALGGTLRVGAATVQVFPGTFAAPVALHASLGSDGGLNVTADPPLAPSLPVRLTLPLAPGSAWADDPNLWPVVVGTGNGEPLVLQPNFVGPESLSVDVPHFSTYLPTTWKDAVDLLARLGKAMLPPPAPREPGGVEISMSLPENYGTDASVSKVHIDVQATTGGANPQTPPAEASPPPEWKQFDGMNVLVSGYTRSASNQPLKEILVANQPLGQGARSSFEVTLPGGGLWEEANAGQAVLVIKLIRNGQTVLERTVPVPIGRYWASFSCRQGRDAARAWRRFTVYYLKDNRQTGYPDTNYTPDEQKGYGSAGSGFPLAAPARVLDACSALSAAYDVFNGPGYFADPANAPSDEMDVWLQNWNESHAGNVRNYIVISLRPRTPQEFRVDAAHELAHRFQHQYSTALFGSGGWLHDASAEYLAQKVFLAAGESNRTMQAFFNGNPSWVNAGLFSSAEYDNYAASSFLAYLADVHGINIAREVWVEGGSGLANLSAWSSHLDSLVKRHTPGSSLAEAWAAFTNAYLLDAKSWGDWTNVALRVAHAEVRFDAAKTSSLFSSKFMTTPSFSAGGVLFRLANTPAATIVTHITGFPAQRASEATTSRYALSPGESADGSVRPITLAIDGRVASHKGSFQLGPGKAALGPGPLARLVHVYRGQGGEGLSWIRYDSWALPVVASVEFDAATGKLTWPKSPVEGLTDQVRQALFDGYEVVARQQDQPDTWSILEEVAGGEDAYEIVIDPNRLTREKLGPAVCVRVRDTAGNTSPEGCPEGPGDLVFRLTSLTSVGDPLVVADQFGALRKPAPMSVSTCLADPTACYFAILPVANTGKPVGALPWICTAEGLKTAGVDYVGTITAGTCMLLTAGDRPADKGIPAMFMTLSATELRSAAGGIYQSESEQPNLMNWLIIEAKFSQTTVTGTMDLKSYMRYETDRVWTPAYNPSGPIPRTPPREAIVRFEGERIK